MLSQSLRLATTAALFLLCAAPVSAQPPSDDAETGTSGRADMLEKIRLIRMYSLIEALELDETMAAKLFPYLRIHDAKLEELQQRKQKSRRALRGMIKSGEFDEKAADIHMNDISDINVAIATTERDQFAGLSKFLSTEQRVRFLAARVQFERKIRDIMREEKKRRRGKRRDRDEREGRPGF